MIVIDASALVNVLLHGPLYASIEKRMREAGRLAAPHLIDAEVGHALRRLLLRGEVRALTVRSILADLDALLLQRYRHDLLLRRALELRDNATVYDAIYIALAEALGVPLVTLDRALGRVPNVRTSIEIIA